MTDTAGGEGVTDTALGEGVNALDRLQKRPREERHVLSPQRGLGSSSTLSASLQTPQRELFLPRASGLFLPRVSGQAAHLTGKGYPWPGALGPQAGAWLVSSIKRTC